MNLSPDHDIEGALAEYIAAAFSPEERQIARMKARIESLPPFSHERIVVLREMMEVRLKQLGGVLPA